MIARRSMDPRKNHKRWVAKMKKERKALKSLPGYQSTKIPAYQYRCWSVYLSPTDYDQLQKRATEAEIGLLRYLCDRVGVFARTPKLRQYFKKNRDPLFFAPLKPTPECKRVDIAISGVERQTIKRYASQLAIKGRPESYPHTLLIREFLNLFLTDSDFRERCILALYQEHHGEVEKARSKLSPDLSPPPPEPTPTLDNTPEQPLNSDIRTELEQILALNKKKKLENKD